MHRCLPIVLALAFGCGEDPAERVVDLQGPRGRVLGPGPWRIDVVTRGQTPTLQVALDDDPFGAVSPRREGERRFHADLGDAPVGTRVSYYATVAGDRFPPDGHLDFVVVDARPDGPEPAEPSQCALTFDRPKVGDVLTLADDNAPQAGLQTIVRLVGSIPDDTAGRLEVNGVGYAAEASAGLLAFRNVTLEMGENSLAVLGTTPSGAECRAAIEVEVR